MDIAMIMSWVYLAMGSIGEDILPTSVVQTYVDLYSTIYSDECLVAYYSVIAATKWVIANTVANTPSQGGGSFRLREGNIEEEEKAGTTSKSSEWQKFLTSFIDDPASLPCQLPESTEENASSAQGKMVIGNTSKAEYNRVVNNRDSLSAGVSVRTGTSKLGSMSGKGRLIR